MILKAIKFFDEEIRRLELAPEINGCEMREEWQEQMEIFKVARAALEKQVPKKPFVPWDSLGKTPYCPNCEEGVWGCDAHCDHCGQALDWSDTE